MTVGIVCGHDVFTMKMMLTGKLVNNKVVDNLLILLVLKFHGHRRNSLRVIAVRSLLSEMTCSLDISERLKCWT